MPFFETEESRSKRLEICHECEHLEKTALGERCGACYCLVEYKAFLKYAKCPLGKWETQGIVE